MNYIEIKIFTDNPDHVTSKLSDMGFEGFVIEDPRDIVELVAEKEHYWWDYVDEAVLAMKDMPANVKLYVEADTKGENQLKDIQEMLPELEIEAKTVCDEDWKDKWKEYFKPTHITDKIVIKPTWEEYSPQKIKGADGVMIDEIVIEIDPGMAFGTGAHPTTSRCIVLLEKYIEKDKDIVLDVGCGSGILSIAACRLGAKSVTAVDIDPLAVEVTTENALLNQVSKKIHVYKGDLTKGLTQKGSDGTEEPFKADVVVANLMAELVIMLSADVRKHLAGKGIFISSGILVEKQAVVEKALVENGFEILETLIEGDWCAIAAKANE